jgi:hypothetical protein
VAGVRSWAKALLFLAVALGIRGALQGGGWCSCKGRAGPRALVAVDRGRGTSGGGVAGEAHRGKGWRRQGKGRRTAAQGLRAGRAGPQEVMQGRATAALCCAGEGAHDREHEQEDIRA